MIVLFQEFSFFQKPYKNISCTFLIRILFCFLTKNIIFIFNNSNLSKHFKNNIWFATIDNIWIVLFLVLHLYRYPQRK